MANAVNFIAKRTFANSFVVIARMWLTSPWGLMIAIGMIAAMTFAFYQPGSLWIPFLGGVVWTTVMLPFLVALQAWKITRWCQRFGLPEFSFDEGGASCRSGEVMTRIGWTGIKKMRISRTTCFVYLTPSVAWFFDRRDLSRDELEAVVELAQRANVKLAGSSRD